MKSLIIIIFLALTRVFVFADDRVDASSSSAFVTAAGKLKPLWTREAAQPILDPSFGSKGFALLMSPHGGESAVGYGVSKDRAGKILIGGVIFDSGNFARSAIWKVDAKGYLDASFGKSGIAYSDGNDWAWAMDIDPQGRIVAAGFEGNTWRDSKHGIVKRYSTDGKTDESFGVHGTATLSNPGGDLATIYAVKSTSDGGIYLAGAVGKSNGKSKAVVWHLLNDGRLDKEFGNGGASILPSMLPEDESRCDAVILDHGSILVTGNLNWKQLAFWKIDSRGIPDRDFAGGGLSTTGKGMGRGIVQGEDGTFWVGGFKYTWEGDTPKQETATLSKFRSDGISEESFGQGGASALPHSGAAQDHESFAIVKAGSGRLYLAGYVDFPGRTRAALWAFTSGGELDPRFGDKGMLALPNAAGGKDDRIYALTTDGDGILAVGYSRDPKGKRRAAIWRIITGR